MSRIPPQSPRNESCVIGSLILDTDDCCKSDILDILTANDFYSHHYQQIFTGIKELHDKGEQIDIAVLHDYLGDKVELDDIVAAADATPGPSNGLAYAKIVKNASRKRAIIQVLSQVAENAYGCDDVDVFIGGVEKKIYDVLSSDDKAKMIPISDLAPLVADDIVSRDGSKLMGISTGFNAIDDMTAGLHPGELTILAGRPGSGKTAMALNIAENVAVDQGVPVLVFSLEMSDRSLIERMLSGRSGVSSTLMRRGGMTFDDMNLVVNASEPIGASRLFIDDRASIDCKGITATARRLQRDEGIRVVIIDYLQLITPPKGESETAKVSEMSRLIKVLARDLDIPIILLCQLNRGPEGRDGHRPRLSDLRQSGSLEQDCHTAILMFREDYYHQAEEGYVPNNKGEAIIAKQRNGPIGTVELVWNPPLTRFSDNIEYKF